MTLARSYLRASPRRTFVLCAGLGGAAVAFALLVATASAPIVLLSGSPPPGSPRLPYDLLVSAGDHSVRTGDAATAAGGISLAQYHLVRRLSGVEVAAPMTMIGYVPVKVTFPVAVPTAAVSHPPKVLSVTAMYHSNGHSGPRGGQNPDNAYAMARPLLLDSGRGTPGAADVAASAAVIRVRTCSGQPSRPRQPVVYVAIERSTPCWSERATHVYRQNRRAPHSSVSVLLSWTFVLPLVAVDPAAEAQLGHLDKAVIRGSYLPATTPAPAGPVPIIVASSLDDRDDAQLSVTALPAERTIGTATVTARTAYSTLVDHIRAASLAVPAYRTTHRQSAVGGPLVPHTASASGAGWSSSRGSLQVKGVFDPDKVAGSKTPPAASAGPATLVMPLQDVSALAAEGAYAGSDLSRPIGSIRVVVAGATAGGPLSLARVRAVAQEIVRATGLHVDVPVAATARVAVGLDPGQLELASLVLLPGLTLFVNGISATLHRRRRELLTLRTLGWRRGQVMRQLLLEFGLAAAASWIVAVALACAIGMVSPTRPARWWPAFAAGAAVAVTLVAIWWRVRQATRESARRRSKRAGVGVVVLAVGCAALGQELAAQWVFHGMIVGWFLGRAVMWQTDPADLAAAVAVLSLTTLAVADVHWLDIGKRAPELRTLQAIGWPARRVVGMVVSKAALVGALGGLAGGAADLACCLAVTRSMPAGMLLLAASMVGLGAAISLIALGLAALAQPRLRDLGGGRLSVAANDTDWVALPR